MHNFPAIEINIEPSVAVDVFVFIFPSQSSLPYNLLLFIFNNSIYTEKEVQSYDCTSFNCLIWLNLRRSAKGGKINNDGTLFCLIKA